jgi:co-chaperonin GroES (HSP10)
MNEIKKVLEIKPLFDTIITTAYQEKSQSKSGILTLNMERADTSFIQEVLAVGEVVTNLKKGDIIKINPTAYGKPKYKEGSLKDGVISENYTIEYNLPTVEVNGCKCLKLHSRDVDYIITKFE